MMNYKFKSETRVHIDMPGVFIGNGIVKGVATTGNAVIGQGYIVYAPNVYNELTYPYEFFVCFEVHMKDEIENMRKLDDE